MNFKTIQMEFGKDCECENDVIKNCIVKTKELQNALEILGIDISRSSHLNYIYTYLLLRLQDTKKEKQNIEMYKKKFERS